MYDWDFVTHGAVTSGRLLRIGSAMMLGYLSKDSMAASWQDGGKRVDGEGWME